MLVFLCIISSIRSRGVEPPTKFSKWVAWQDSNFERGFAEKDGVTFFRGLRVCKQKCASLL